MVNELRLGTVKFGDHYYVATAVLHDDQGQAITVPAEMKQKQVELHQKIQEILNASACANQNLGVPELLHDHGVQYSNGSLGHSLESQKCWNKHFARVTDTVRYQALASRPVELVQVRLQVLEKGHKTVRRIPAEPLNELEAMVFRCGKTHSYTYQDRDERIKRLIQLELEAAP